jgi:carbon storage regulator
MLVLTRKTDQAIVVPSCNLTVTVVNISGERVKLGISAPVEVVVHREEVWRRMGRICLSRLCQL